MKKIISIVFCSLFIFSCQKAIEIDRDTIKPKLVVNCILSPEEDTIKLSLSESRDLLYDKTTFPIVQNATVELFENGTKLGNLNFKDGLYVLPYTVKNGRSYNLKASKEGFDDVTAVTSISSPISNTKVTIEELDNNSLNSNVLLTDIVNEDNYYQVTMKWGEFTDDSAIINGEFYYEPWLNTYSCSNDFIIEYPQSDLLEGSSCGDRFLFSDANFKNNSYNFKTFTYAGSYYPNQEGYKTRVIIEVSSLNYDFYNYYITKSIFQNNLGNPFAEPVPVYSNIENGYGIFGSSSTVADTTIFE